MSVANKISFVIQNTRYTTYHHLLNEDFHHQDDRNQGTK